MRFGQLKTDWALADDESDGICCLFDRLFPIGSRIGLPGSCHVPILGRQALPAGRGDKRRAFMVREQMSHKAAV